jgi:hypothetical protein
MEEEISFNQMTEMTIGYLTNKKIYEKLTKHPLIINSYNKDKLFYKKRIHNLHRNLMNDKQLYPDFLQKAFDNYMKLSIEYFKMIDHTDIIQEDYIGLQLLEEEIPDEEEEIPETNIEEESYKSLYMNTPHVIPTLDNFVKIIKKTEDEKPMYVPQQKEINLNNPELKKKGIFYT